MASSLAGMRAVYQNRPSHQNVPRKTGLSLSKRASGRHCHLLTKKYVKNEKQEDQGSSVSDTEPKDFWEGEQWEVLGTIASYAVPIIIASGVAIGFFSAATYNNDATVFLESPKSPEDTIRLIPADEILK